MKHLCRQGWLHDAHVVLRAKLEVTFDARRRVFRTLPFVPMRQQHDQSTQAAPFHFAGADELIDDDLRTVGKIAELGFPDHQCVRIGRRVTVLEAEYGLFRQKGIDHFEARLILGQELQRLVNFAGFLVVYRGVAMKEGAALTVLSR